MTLGQGTGSELEFRILGPTEMWASGVRIPLTAAKQRTVLAALLISPGRFVSDLWLSELLWDAAPPATRSAQLYTYISRLRRICGPELRLARKHRGYHLSLGDAWFDWDVFRQLAEQGRDDLLNNRYEEASACLGTALELWSGPALSDVTEFLARAELPALEESRLTVVENRIEAELELGRHSRALPELTRLVAEHPTRESLRGHLMTALYRCGRQMDALRVYEQGRQVLQQELGVDPGPALRELHRSVLLEELAAPVAAEALTVASNAAPSPWTGLVPAMLPMDTTDFVGHGAELAEVLEGLRGSGGPHRGVVLTGAAGAGKSVLAVRAGHVCRDDFRQGQLYIDLRREDGSPKNPLDVLGSFLRALIPVRGDLPETLDERSQLYRSVLSRRRVLVVLDNAVDDRQVRPLLASGEGCRMLITSRSAMASLEGVRAVPVGRLDDAAARQLIESVVGAARLDAEPEAAGRLVELCDGLPLALRICAARLAARPQWPVARLVDRLDPGEGQARHEEWSEGSLDLRAALRTSVLQLEPGLRPVLRVLARAAPGPFTAAEAAEHLGWSEERTQTALDALAEVWLLEVDAGYGPDTGPCTYRCSPLVRLLAR
ncbi:BTAD domain-containing putative transcriptional regulator [Streptomyces sp. NPDC087218]|uniref:AfsR/SARP family transcriptional regulator n=1 Tax=Streptomyces sp. NPDC087218 TaxID=3365769 RepID=UPI003800DD34